MNRFSRSHLSDHSLLGSAETHAKGERVSTADLLADLAEIDARKLYLPAAHPSMYAYCLGELHLCEQAAYKRILAARTARRFPVLFEAVAQGRLHLSAVCLLAPHLTEDTVEELLAAATHKSKSEIERLLAARFPQPDVLAWVEPIPPSSPAPSAEPQVLGRLEGQLSPGIVPAEDQLSPGIVQAPAQVQPRPVGERPRVTPLSSQSFAVQFTMTQSTHDKLRYAQALMGHQVASGDIAAVFERALDALVAQLEKTKFAATGRPRGGARRPTASARHIPAHVMRAVWERDGAQCTFVSETGRRCPARKPLEFDHVHEFARGGEATVAGIRLRCRAHNQYQAERTFGAEFMRHKRLAAAEARAAARAGTAVRERVGAAPESRAATEARAAAQMRVSPRAPADASERAAARPAAAQQAAEQDVVPWLRALGFSAAEARRAAALCEDIPDASLEERVRRALSCVHVRGARVIRPTQPTETETRGHEARAPAAL